MAFMISGTQSESEKESPEHLEGKDSETVGVISSQLHLKPSLSPKASKSQTLDKQVVLRRILQRKCYNKAKSAFEALVGSPEANTATAQEPKWLQYCDAFSAP